MGISSALGMARSGLGAAGTQADIISRNIAHADTPGHTRKTAQIVTGPTGEVQVRSIDRSVDALLTRLERTSMSELSARNTMAEGVRGYTNFLGQPDDETSPAAMMNRLNNALVTLSGMPEEQAAQLEAIASAKGIAAGLNELSSVLADVSDEVGMSIRYDISSANEALQSIAELNKKIQMSERGSILEGEHLDNMDRAIDALSEFMDVQKVVARDGTVNLYSGGGTELVAGDRVHDISYDSGSGTLRAGSVEITPGRQGVRGFEQGSLSGLFALKDRILPSFSAQLDSLAGAMIQGFESANPFGAGGTGLLTDDGAPYDAANQEGMAARIRINPEADPDQGGTASVLQSGNVPGTASGDSRHIDAMIDAIAAPVTVDTAGLGSGMSMANLAGTMVSSQQSMRANLENEASATAIAGETISASRSNFEGVNIDDEMQKLLMVQQSYAANAKVLTTVSNMLDTLLAAV